jgi:hypothetical protein
MLERAMVEARERGIEDRVVGIPTDLNTWRADAAADIYFANHSLHHVVALESLFAEVEASLNPAGVLLVNDMIGRNGHVRWPEAAEFVRRIWNVAPEGYRWNPFQKAADEVYPDIDCSNSGFEGIRAQDILPLLLEQFHPDVYVCFSNIVDPFVDRVYGPNFDATNPEDLAFIDAVGRLDDATIDLQLVTPTHLIGSFRIRPVPCRYPRQRSPSRTVRLPERGLWADGADTSRSTDPLDEAGQRRALDTAMAELQLGLDEARARYEHLRHRKAVRIALTIAALRHWRPVRAPGREAR